MRLPVVVVVVAVLGCGGAEEVKPTLPSVQMSPTLQHDEAVAAVYDVVLDNLPEKVKDATHASPMSLRVFSLPIENGVERWAVLVHLHYGWNDARPVKHHRAFLVLRRDGEKWGMSDFDGGPLD